MIRLDFGEARHGWLPVSVRASEHVVELTASYTPSDSLAQLVDSALALLSSDGTTRVTWHAEPTEYDFTFTRAGASARLTVVEFHDSRRGGDRGTQLLVVDDAPAVIARACWRALRDLQTRPAFEQAWHRPFPTAAMDHLTATLQASKPA